MVDTILDPLDVGLVLAVDAAGLLGRFNRAGLLAAADVHVARRLGRLGGDADDVVHLAVALAVRAPRVGHVNVDLATVRLTAAAETETDGDVDLDTLPWPEPRLWRERLANSPLVSVGEDGTDELPLRLVGTTLYLDRFWRDERAVAADLLDRTGAAAGMPAVDEAVLADGLVRLFPDDPAGEQAEAAAAAVRQRFTVVAGGPGTGKTTTVARLIALLEEQARARGTRLPLIALGAPTGKAATRMAEAVHSEAAGMDVDGAVRDRLSALGASTLHRLLGRQPGNSSRFRHHRRNRLPHDVVIVDESSMVSLWLMARLLEAVRPDARLVLVGDPEQLASVEAGAVFGDIVGPDRAATGNAPAEGTLAASVRGLHANHRFSGALADLAGAIRAGDADAAVAVLRSDEATVKWLEVEVGAAPAPFDVLEPVRAAACAHGAALLSAATASDGRAALDVLGRFRVLCAHRQGPDGVSTWNPRLEEWLADAVPGVSSDGAWYVGRPVIVTANDYSLRLFNGDTGVVLARPSGGLTVAFERSGGVVEVGPSRLGAVDTVFATTVHKAQGSEFDEVAILLPATDSRVLTRELLYTAVTRARRRVIVAGTESAVRAAIGRPIARASGLTARLWGSGLSSPPSGLSGPEG
ncbi:MAG TPA: exodeoxyribonuclease V subunit alpha [Acidimicrobiales bacterium]|nr:exodeoxyribonuclease V subunit alpha [Acidimicrobiales bacterium]